ncbi:MAG: hypothetical protein E7378_01840 [Clostridiales bacterium]|nr:hypothetical protein [Clostridiales bacterium]
MAKKNIGKVFNFIAFVGLLLVAVVLILQKIFSGNLINAFRTIGECIAYATTAVAGFFYVRTKRSPWWYVAYFVAVALIIVFIILR